MVSRQRCKLWHAERNDNASKNASSTSARSWLLFWQLAETSFMADSLRHGTDRTESVKRFSHALSTRLD